MTISNDEAFAKADFAANKLEKQLGRKLTADEYSEFVWHTMIQLKRQYEAIQAQFDPNSKAD